MYLQGGSLSPPSADLRPLKILRHGRMAALVKLRRGIGMVGECPLPAPPYLNQICPKVPAVGLGVGAFSVA